MLRAARELLAVRSPLDAELMVTELLGTWWGQHPAAGACADKRRRADIEELVGEGLVATRPSRAVPAALALLSGHRLPGHAPAGGPGRAGRPGADGARRGPAGLRPTTSGAVEAAECYVNSDAFGDRDEVVCVFSYAGQEQHALVVVVDYNTGGMARDGWVTSQVGKLLQYCREGSETTAAAARRRRGPKPCRAGARPAATAADSRPSATSAAGWCSARSIPPRPGGCWRRRWRSREAADPAVSSSFASYHAFIRARIRTLPPPRATGPATGGRGRPRPAPWSTGPWLGLGAATARRHAWTRDRRAMLVAEFLASDEAEDLSDTARRPAAAPTTSSTTAVTVTSGGRCG